MVKTIFQNKQTSKTNNRRRLWPQLLISLFNYLFIYFPNVGIQGHEHFYEHFTQNLKPAAQKCALGFLTEHTNIPALPPLWTRGLCRVYLLWCVCWSFFACWFHSWFLDVSFIAGLIGLKTFLRHFFCTCWMLTVPLASAHIFILYATPPSIMRQFQRVFPFPNNVPNSFIALTKKGKFLH